jgi:hypothetical protein
VIALGVVLGCGVVRLGCVFVVFGCLLVRFVCHWSSPFLAGHLSCRG